MALHAASQTAPPNNSPTGFTMPGRSVCVPAQLRLQYAADQVA